MRPMNVRQAAPLLALCACFAPTPQSAPCVTEDHCNLREGGQCLPSPIGQMACAYPAGECPGGLAWGELTPALDQACVSFGPTVDAGGDAATDATNTGCTTRIAFSDGEPNAQEVYTANSDGTGVINLSQNPAIDTAPAYVRPSDAVVFVSHRSENADIYTVPALGGAATSLTSGTADDKRPTPSPDGARIAFVRQASGAPNPTLWVMDANGGNARELSTLPVWHTTEISWSPDSQRLAFVSGRDVYSAVVSTGATTNLCTWTSGMCDAPAWSPNGQRIAMQVFSNSNLDVYVLNSDGTAPNNMTNTPTVDERSPAWSPASDALAFVNGSNGNIVKLPYPTGAPVQITTHTDALEGDAGPRWSPDGSRVAFSRTLANKEQVIGIVRADGTNYFEISVSGKAYGPSWSRCQ